MYKITPCRALDIRFGLVAFTEPYVTASIEIQNAYIWLSVFIHSSEILFALKFDNNCKVSCLQSESKREITDVLICCNSVLNSH